MFSLVSSSDSPSGGSPTVPPTVSRTALREALTESRTVTRTTLREALTETRTVTRTALREALSNSPSGKKDRTYDLSTGLHTYGVSYPAGLHRPELVPTGTQTTFRLYETISRGGREKARSCMAFVCERRMSLDSPHHPYL